MFSFQSFKAARHLKPNFSISFNFGNILSHSWTPSNANWSNQKTYMVLYILGWFGSIILSRIRNGFTHFFTIPWTTHSECHTSSLWVRFAEFSPATISWWVSILCFYWLAYLSCCLSWSNKVCFVSDGNTFQQQI